MRIDFAASRPSTLGVEWEVLLVDRETRQPTARADEVHRALAGTPEGARLDHELLENTVEIVTGVHETVASAVAEIDRVRRAVLDAADALGLGVLCAGTHPFADAVQPFRHSERYRQLIDRTQWWGRLMAIYGLHVHVGLDRVDKAIPVMHGMLSLLPHLLALSASSPWWQGVNTGYASNRAMLFRQLPTAGLPMCVDGWAGFETIIDGMVRTGVIGGVDEVRWDVRPAPRFGTVENRVCDGVPTLTEVAALTAFVQSAVTDLSRRLDAGETITPLPDWVVAENKWRASRYGLAAEIITGPDLAEAPVVEQIRLEVARLEPVAASLGCAAELALVPDVLAAGASYQRQQRVAVRASGSLPAVVDALVAEFAAGRPLAA
ncbi:MAG: glutamate--cysteine ligase [Pseudoclavibacter caeni]|jgi:glutamate---cysteine ligase / carboxylate-amine ligase